MEAKPRVVPLYSPAKARESRLGGAVLGVLLGAAPALFAAIAAKPLGAVVVAAVAVAVLLPVMWGSMKVLGMLLPELRVGVDGISLRGGFTSATRFIPFEALVGLEVVTFVYSRRGGQALGLKVSYDGKAETLGDFDAVEDGEAVLREVLEAKARWARERSPVAGLAALDRAGAPVGAWLDALHGRARGEADFRHAVLDRDRLLELVAGGAATAEHRVGAAVVLAAKEGAAARAQIRVAAEATANPKLRVALASIARDAIDERAIEEALAEERRQA